MEATTRSPGAAGARGDAEAPGLVSRDILLVEDNEDAGQTLADLLGLLGHRVRLACDGRAGLAFLEERPAEVVLCDIGLPDMSGYDVAAAIRARPGGAEVRLVAMTGYVQPADRLRSAEAGFDAHLAKPPDLEALLALLR